MEINKKAQFAVDITKQYAVENQISARDTTDLSPLEVWLILKLLAVTDAYPNAKEIIWK